MLFRALVIASELGLSLASITAFWPITRIVRRMRPLAGLCFVLGASQFAYWAASLTAMRIPGIPDMFAHLGRTIIEFRAFTTAGVLIGLLILLLREYRQVSLDRALLAGEMQAARSVQRYLIPDNLPPTPGLAIQSEYRPSREVGGDFFQVLPQSDGSTLIVIGDVAGKGVEAGMLATLIVGAIRTAAAFTNDPEHILALLNDRLRGRGLVTCMALRVECDGRVTLVNAGHLPPYLNGKELAIEGALPLGASPGISFPVARFTLEPGNSLVLMTDGVAEAKNAQGELFGFERIGELVKTQTPGSSLAEAAQTFGQNDDITVLTLTFAPAEVIHA
jgi:serine phosphatase RsbU (regulator of sigma subunit)